MLIFALFISILNSVINGYDFSLMNSIVVIPSFISHFGRVDSNPNFAALFFGLLSLGSLCSSLFIGLLINRFGRLCGLRVGSALIVIGTCLEIIPNDLILFCLGRFLIGFGVGLVTATAPVYIQEISPPQSRGRAGALFNTGWSFGSIPASIITYYCSFISTDFSWIFPLAVQGILSIVVLAGSFIIPESPRYLYSKGDISGAEFFFLNHHEENEEYVESQMTSLKESFAESNSSPKSSIISLFTTSRYQMLIITFVCFYTQYAGNFLSFFYVPQIAPYFGVPKNDPSKALLFNVLNNVTSGVVAVIGASQADKFSRKKVLVSGSLICCFGITGFTVFCGVFQSTSNPSHGLVAWAFLEVFTLSYSFFISILGLYLVEIVDFNSRANAMAIAGVFLNVFSFSEQYVFNHFLATYGYLFFGMYGVIDLVAAIVIQKWFPETRGLDLEEIQACFKEGDVVSSAERILKNKVK